MLVGLFSLGQPLCLAVALGLTAQSRRLEGQVVQGTVREIVTNRPLRGIDVLLLDVRDSALRSVATSARGEFRLTADSAGSYSLSLRHIGFEPMLTTPMKLGPRDTIVLSFTMMPTASTLDTMKVTAGRSLLGVTAGHVQFLEHYQRGVGVFISGAEMAGSRKGIAAYVAAVPGFLDSGAQRNTPNEPASCQTLNAYLHAQTPSMNTLRGGPSAARLTPADFCMLTDEMGRQVMPVDAPCVISQVDRIGWVKRVEGTDLIVQPIRQLFTPSVGLAFHDADPGGAPDIVVHLHEVIGVELYRTPDELPDNLKIRGATLEAQALTSRCGHIQFWTRTAW